MRLYENGAMSRCMKKWRVGDYVECRGPFGEYAYEPNEHAMLLCLAGGTGVAPIVQVVREVLGNEDDFTRLKVLYSVQSVRDVMLRGQWKTWAGYWNFELCYCVTGGNSRDSNKKHREKNGSNDGNINNGVNNGVNNIANNSVNNGDCGVDVETDIIPKPSQNIELDNSSAGDPNNSEHEDGSQVVPFGYGEHVVYGRINEEILKSKCENVDVGGVGVLICGSKTFNEDMKELVRSVLGVHEKNIFCFT